jgi:hypothetical protein
MLTTLGKQVLTIVIAVLLTIAAWSPRLDDPAMQRVDAGLERALATFAGARALNAAISLAQGTEFTAGIGAQVTLSIGQVLDPVNDMVEVFSNVMLLASVAFGIQKVLLVIGQYVYVKWALTGVLAVWTATRLLSKARPRWLDVALVLMLMVRFAVPVVSLGSDAIYEHFLQQQYSEGQRTLDTTTAAVDNTVSSISAQGAMSSTALAQGQPPYPVAPSPNAASNGGISESVSAIFGKAAQTTSAFVQSLDPRPAIERLKEKAGEATRQLINLIVVFLLQTVLVPLALVWALYVALRNALAPTRSS